MEKRSGGDRDEAPLGSLGVRRFDVNGVVSMRKRAGCMIHSLERDVCHQKNLTFRSRNSGSP